MIKLPHLETNITTACQLSCRDCNHFIPIQKADFIEPDTLKNDLEILSKIATTEAFALIGGEPLIHPAINRLLIIAQMSRITNVVEVWTNGLLIKKMDDTFWENTDRLVLSLYEGKSVDLPFIRDKCGEFTVDLEIKKHEPFTNVLHSGRSKKRAVNKWNTCWYRTFTHVVDNGFFYRCCTSPFIPKLIYGDPEGTDGLSLEDITEEKLRAFLDRKKPMKSCEVCGGHNGLRRKWQEVDRRQWLELTQI